MNHKKFHTNLVIKCFSRTITHKYFMTMTGNMQCIDGTNV